MSTDIEWTEETWNPVVGCSVVSPGCTNCYAMRKAWRLAEISRGTSKGAHGVVHYRGLTEKRNGKPVWTGAMKTAPEKLFLKPLRLKKPRAIFVNSMGDLFHEAIPDALIDRVFAVMALCPQHTFQVLTKRAARMREYMVSRSISDADGFEADDIRAQMTALVSTPSRRNIAPALRAIPLGTYCRQISWPLPNVWLGVSAEDQTRAEERIPVLLETPAALRFVSCEPLLGPIDLAAWLACPERGDQPREASATARPQALADAVGETRRGTFLNWVIAGGESGPGARPMHPDWARALRDQCADSHTPFFFKQWGSWFPGELEDVGDRLVAAPDIEHDRTAADWQGRWKFTTVNGAGMFRVGKKAAGAMLDGREHRAFPPAPAPLPRGVGSAAHAAGGEGGSRAP